MIALLTLLLALGAARDPIETERIRSHLELVERLLRAQNPPASQALAAARARNLDALRDYWQLGRFPVNTTVPGGRNPIFIDENGVACAAGAVMIASGHAPLARRISKTLNTRYLDEMHDPELDEWVAQSGLSLGELRLIQPSYAFERAFDDDLIEAASVLDASKVKLLAPGASGARLNHALVRAVVSSASATRQDFGRPAHFVTDGVELVEYLLARGANPNAIFEPQRVNLTPLAILKLQTIGAPRIEAALIAHGARLTETEAVLVAANEFDCERLPALLAKPGVKFEEHQPHPMTVHFGSQRTMPRACALTLLNSPKVSWRLKGPDESWFSMLGPDPEYVATLVTNRAVRVQTETDLVDAFVLWQRLHLSPDEAQRGWAKTIRGALDASTVTFKTRPCLREAVEAVSSGDFEAVDVFAKRGGALAGCGLRLSPRLVNRTKRLSPEELATTRFLLRTKAVTPYDDWQSVAPLPWAASVGDLEFARALLEADPKLVDAAPGNGCTPLAIAAARDDEPFVSLLLSYKPDLSKQFAPTARCGWPNKVGQYSNEYATLSEVKLSPSMRKKLKLSPPRTAPESHVDPVPQPAAPSVPRSPAPGEFTR